MTLIANLSSQVSGPGEGLCVCVMRVHVGLCVCICFPGLCVSLCSSSALHLGLPLSCGPLSSGNKAGFLISRDEERCLRCTGVAWGVVARGRCPWGEQSFLCQIPKCHLGAACAARLSPRLRQGPKRLLEPPCSLHLNCLGFGGQRLRNFLGSPAGGILWDRGSMGSL